MITRLTGVEIRAMGAPLGRELAAFLPTLEVGEGGLMQLQPGVRGYSRQTVKATVQNVADGLGMTVRFRRSSEREVIFARTA